MRERRVEKRSGRGKRESNSKVMLRRRGKELSV